MREQSLTKRAQRVTVARAARMPWVLRARSARAPPSPPLGVPGASLGSQGQPSVGPGALWGAEAGDTRVDRRRQATGSEFNLNRL